MGAQTGFNSCMKCFLPFHRKCIMEEDVSQISAGGHLVCAACRQKQQFYAIEEYKPDEPVDQPMTEEDLKGERKLRATKK
jgi:hypothetical protein